MSLTEERREAKKALKGAFPHIKFSATNYHYRGTFICYNNGPTEQEVKDTLDKGGFDLGYTVIQREITHDVFVQIAKTYCERYKIEWKEDQTETEGPLSISQIVHMFYNATSFKGENPIITGLLDTGLRCGDRAEMEFLNWEEEIKGKLYKCDVESIQAKGAEAEKKFQADMKKAEEQRQKDKEEYARREQQWKETLSKLNFLKTEIKGTTIEDRFVFPKMNKNDLYGDYVEEYSRGNYDMVRTQIRTLICCDDFTYETIKNNLLANFDFLKDVPCGTESPYEPPEEYKDKEVFFWPSELIEEFKKDCYGLGVLIYCPKTKSAFVANTEGYGYCRYVGILTPKQKEQLIELAMNLQNLH